MAILCLVVLLCASGLSAAEALIQDRTHESQVFGETRQYRIFLPPDYGASGKRYPVIYWFHGYSERSNKPVAGRDDRNYDSGTDYGGDNIANYVGAHGVIVVKWDGYNPRKPGEPYPRPYNISPVETDRQFPLYFPELVEYIDSNYRTIADREHRATSGLSMGGFMSYWVSGKYPHLISSASNFMGSSEFFVGPRGFPVEYRHEEMRDNYEGVRTRIVIGTRDFIQFYHRRMNAIWNYTRPFHESEEFDFDHGTPGMARTFDFHMNAFAKPLPKPAVWSHIDVYPNFTVWGWEVASNRRQPGLTELRNVSSTGFRSTVREWLPGGRTMRQVKLTIRSERLYKPGGSYSVAIIRLRDGVTRRLMSRAEADGRLAFQLDGDEYEVGICAAPPQAVLALTGYRLEGADWAIADKPVKLRARFSNKGAAPASPAKLRWYSANPAVQIDNPGAELPRLAPGQSAEAALAFVAKDARREIVKLFAIRGDERLPLEVPLFPNAETAADFRIADGREFTVYQHAVQKTSLSIGEGNGDGRVQAGERIGILLPDGDAHRMAELFTSDECVDNSTRLSDVWSSYDHVGASAKYSLPLIKAGCHAGHLVRFLARVQLPDKPNHRIRYAVVHFAIAGMPPPRKK